MDPSLIKKYEKLFDETSHDGRLFILKIFQICGNEQVKTFLSNKLKDRRFTKENEEISAALKEKIPLELNLVAKEAKMRAISTSYGLNFWLLAMNEQY